MYFIAVSVSNVSLFWGFGVNREVTKKKGMSAIRHEERVRHEGLREKIMSAEQAATFILHDMNVGMSGFTGAGYPKAVPAALAERIKAAQARGEEFKKIGRASCRERV